MADLIDSISLDNLIIICAVMSFIALFLAIAITIELFSSRRRKVKIGKEETVQDDNAINIKEDANITYVEEDEEFEKTKAKLELAKLKERLEKEEELAKEKEIVTSSDNLNVLDTEKEENKEHNEYEKSNITYEEKTENIEAIDNKEEVNQDFDDGEDEKNAIISYDELKNAASFGYTDEEMENYVDEKDAIISIDELERLYRETNEFKTKEIPKVDIKSLEELPEISSEKKFQSTPLISPVYGTYLKDEEIENNMANIEKFSDEIKKTNEFLRALRELKKNLQ